MFEKYKLMMSLVVLTSSLGQVMAEIPECSSLNGRRCKDIEVVPYHKATNVELEISIDQSSVEIGKTVEFQFRSNQEGYVSLWDIGTSGKVHRIYPASPNGDLKVEANHWYGAGGKGESYKYKIIGPQGMEDVYMIWSVTPDLQPQESDYQTATSLTKDIEVVMDRKQATSQQWATTKVTFQVVDPTRPVTDTAPPENTVTPRSNQVYILAMGANVEPLTKTNHDAEQFANNFKKFFKVADNNVKFIQNASRKDFRGAVAQLVEEVKPDDLVFIFFSGHGYMLTDDNGDETDGLDEVFVMYDPTQPGAGSEEQMVRDDEYAQWVKNLKTSKLVTVIDACHSGGLQKGTTATGAKVKFYPGKKLKTSPPAEVKLRKGYIQKDMAGGIDSTGDSLGTDLEVKGVILAAAKEDEYALEGNEGGIFVTTLLQQFSSIQTDSSLFDIFQSTKQQVQQVTNGQQTPTIVGKEGIVRDLKAE
ncbi:MAG: hypothetical protein BWK78_01615 [Thiotrichaceae bacterium IS1]|nr:MAG: hypothetical protein BWK78_01615 [Thiotrichaceae bacterium IS1]